MSPHAIAVVEIGRGCVSDRPTADIRRLAPNERSKAHAERCSLRHMVHRVAEQLRGDQRYAAVGDEKTRAVPRGLDAGGESFRQRAIPVDDAVLELDVTAHLDVRQDDRILDRAVAVNVDIGEKERAT